MIVNKRWSFDSISELLKLKYRINISYILIYQYTEKSKSEEGKLFNYIRRDKYLFYSREYKYKIKNRVLFDLILEVVNKWKSLRDYCNRFTCWI